MRNESSQRAQDREVNERYGVARGTPVMGTALPTVADVAEPDRLVYGRDTATGETLAIGQYVNPVRLAFRADRPVTTRTTSCRFCGTECLPGQAALIGKGRVTCATCSIAWQNGRDSSAMPHGWDQDGHGRQRARFGYVVNGCNMRPVKAAPPVPVRTGPAPGATYTPPAPMPEGVNIAPARTRAPVPPAASAAGRALAARKAEKRAAKLAAK